MIISTRKPQILYRINPKEAAFVPSEFSA